MADILSVEDDPSVRRLLKRILEAQGFSTEVAANAKEFLESLTAGSPSLCLIDLYLPDTSGFDLLRKLAEEYPEIPAVVLTVSDSIQDSVEAMKLGAKDYLTKPLETQRLVTSLRNVLRLAEHERVVRSLRADLPEAHAPEHFVGSSAPMEQLRDLIRNAAAADMTVLIQGETGAGKEMVARSLHYSGLRRNGPFIEVNCAALTETLLESELFGHAKGAFTGADSSRRGQFEQAHEGSIFLDEIGDMPLSAQAKILRVLQEQRLKRVGGDLSIQVDVRLICATNRNIENEMQKGRFREDLFYRINTLIIEVPPLRDRPGDIPELARHFLQKASRSQKRTVPQLSTSALEALGRHTWPGNVRELEHAIERAVLLCGGNEILPKHLPVAIGTPGRRTSPQTGQRHLVKVVEQLERSLIDEALQKCGWVKARAARSLGITERMISYKMFNLGMKPPAR